jgi:putative hydrolase of the HAD superfamily
MTGRKIILFDAGGTLLEVDYRHLQGVLRGGNGGPALPEPPGESAFLTAERPARAWFLSHTGEGGMPPDAWRGYFGRLFTGAGLAEEVVPGALDRLWDLNVRSGLWHRAAAEAAEALSLLREAGFRMAVISNSEGRVEQDIAEAGLGGFFECVTDSSRVGVEKPDPRIFRLTCERLGTLPEACVYVGDIYGIDVVGARRAGLAPVLIDRFRLQEGADCPRIESLLELPELLRE